MNIAFLTNSIGYGGVEKMIAFISSSLSERGHEVWVINFNSVPKYVQSIKRPFNDRVHVIDLDIVNYGLFRHYYRIYQVCKLAVKFKFDVIIGFTFFPNFYAKITSVFVGIPSIMSERGDPNRTIGKSLLDRIIVYCINHSRGAVFQTEGASYYYSKKLQKRCRIIPNPIYLSSSDDIRKFKPISQREKSIVAVGRFQNIQKRYDVLIEAFRIVIDSHPDYVLKLYGSGDDEKLIRDWVSEAGMDNNVLFMGLAKNTISVIKNEGIFVTTSDYEGISNSLLEAMAVGLPVVATDCTPGGARMLIKDHQNGILTPVGDASAVASAILEFIDHPELADKCGREATGVLDRFSPKKIIDLWESYLMKVVTKSVNDEN